MTTSTLPPHAHAADALTGLRIGDFLDLHADAFPTRVAVSSAGGELTYAQLKRAVDRCAAAMLAEGLQPGDRVAVLCTPRWDALVTFLAAARIGVMWLGLNPRYRLPELRYVVGDARPVLLFGIDALEGHGYEADVAALRGEFPFLRAAVGLDGAGAYGIGFDAWVEGHAGPEGRTLPQQARARLEAAIAAVEPGAPALLVYTSGSSGRPKGVILRHRELLRRSRTQLERFPCTPYPKLMNPLPINHIGGMHFLSLYTFVGGGTLMLEERFVAERFVEAMAQQRINIVLALPTIFKMIVDVPAFRPQLLDSLQCFVYSGAAMSVELLEVLTAARCQVGLTYGMTETCGSVTYSDPGAPLEVLANSIGRPQPAGEVRVADEHGRACAVDEPGEMQVRPEFCMGGYFGRPEATRDAYTRDGWLRTGDTAILRADGNLRFVGRRSEMFKSGGYNVYPREVELALEQANGVHIAAVVAVPDTVFDEVGWAYVVPKPGEQVDEQALRQWCRDSLANYKVPKRFIVCDELPLLPVGKVDKVTLREQARKEAEALAAA
jgi:acyl-CoA synthetase (AMP-forming)/AMP-acid ligase II